jgi:hypothetical protein
MLHEKNLAWQVENEPDKTEPLAAFFGDDLLC